MSESQTTQPTQTKSNKMVNIAIYTAVFLVMGFLILYFVGPKFGINLFGKGKDANNIEYSRVDGFPRAFNTAEQVNKARLVIKTEEELKQAISNIDKSGEIKLPKINFEKKMALLVTSKTRNTGGYETRIRKIELDKDDLVVTIRDQEPGKTCMTTQQLNVPMDLVVLDKTDLSIEWQVRQEVKECN